MADWTLPIIPMIWFDLRRVTASFTAGEHKHDDGRRTA
jgi:hypothetical protein